MISEFTPADILLDFLSCRRISLEKKMILYEIEFFIYADKCVIYNRHFKDGRIRFLSASGECLSEKKCRKHTIQRKVNIDASTYHYIEIKFRDRLIIGKTI